MPNTRLMVLTVKALPTAPSELLSSRAMTELVAELHTRFNTVIFDAPPVLGLPDTVTLVDLCDSALFVVGAGRAPREDVESALERLDAAKVIGVVLNRCAGTRSATSAHTATGSPRTGPRGTGHGIFAAILIVPWLMAMVSRPSRSASRTATGCSTSPPSARRTSGLSRCSEGRVLASVLLGVGGRRAILSELRELGSARGSLARSGWAP